MREHIEAVRHEIRRETVRSGERTLKAFESLRRRSIGFDEDASGPRRSGPEKIRARNAARTMSSMTGTRQNARREKTGRDTKTPLALPALSRFLRETDEPVPVGRPPFLSMTASRRHRHSWRFLTLSALPSPQPFPLTTPPRTPDPTY